MTVDRPKSMENPDADAGNASSKTITWLIATVVILFTSSLMPGDVMAQDTTRIMLLGDSITSGFVGSDPIGGFRDDLYYMLVSEGGIFDFVGTLNDGEGFDADHEGHGGYYGRVYIINSEVDSYLVATDPQMVLIHLGTNNINGDISIAETMTQFQELLDDHIYAYNPSMIVHLSGIIPRLDEKDSLTTELNSEIYNLVLTEQGMGYQIKYVDHNTAFKRNPNWQLDYMVDEIHPNNAGYAVIAQTYFDSLSNEDIFDNIPPAAISDLTISMINSRTALLNWTATGDNGIEGIAEAYDVRYSTSPITESNFFSAAQAIGEPKPSSYGSPEEFTAGGLDPGTFYYFAVKAKDEAGNYSPLSPVPSASTHDDPTLCDDFERTSIGPDWNADPDFILNNGELSNESLVEGWDYTAVYTLAPNPEWVSLRWGTNADTAGIGSGGFALMLDAPSPDANGYLVFRHSSLDRYELYEIVNGAPSGSAVGSSPNSNLPFPTAGDEFSVVMSTDTNGHHFDCYINGVYDTRVSDTTMVQGNADTLWSGVMLHGNRDNNVEDYCISGPDANMAPGSFSLLSPSNGSTVATGTPMLDWEDSVDPNLSDSVLYSLQYGTSAVFSPESTTVVDDLSSSDYSIPPMDLVTLVRRGMDDSPGSDMLSSADNGVRASGVKVGEPIVMGVSGAGSDPSPSSLPDDVVIYWKVRAYDTGGLETWSSETDWSFMVSIPEPPLPFSLLRPSDADTVHTLTPTLMWQATTDPDPGDTVTYWVYYDDDPTFIDPRLIMGIQDTLFVTPPLVDSTTYYWKIEAVDSRDLVTESTETFSFLVLIGTGIGDDGGGQVGLPKVFALGQNYPNPFNPSTSIRYDVPEGASSEGGVPVLLQVYTLRGQLIATLENGRNPPGSYVVHWDGRNDSGERVGSGIYLYRIQAGAYNATKKMVIIK